MTWQAHWNRLARCAAQSSASRFLAAGAANTAITYVLYVVLLRVTSYTYAYTTAFFAGVFIAYIFQSKYVFRVILSWRKFSAFPLVYAVQYIVGTLTLRCLVEWQLLPALAAFPITLFITVPLGYVMSRRLLAGTR